MPLEVSVYPPYFFFTVMLTSNRQQVVKICIRSGLVGEKFTVKKDKVKSKVQGQEQILKIC